MTGTPDFSDTEGALSAFYDLLPKEVTGAEDLASRFSIKGAFAAVWEWLFGEGDPFYLSLVFLFGLGLLFFLAETLSSSSALGDTAKNGLSVVFGVGIVSVVSPLITGLYEGLTGVFEFFSAALPFLFSAGISCGGTAAAGTLYVGNQTLLWLLEGVMSVFLPFSSLLLSLSLVSFLSPAVFRFSRSLKRGITALLGFIGVLFSAVLSFSAFLTNAADTMTLRTAKYAVSQMVPVVGSSVSSAVSALAASMSYLKSTVGAVGIYTVAVMVAPVFLRLLLLRLVLSFSAALFSAEDGGIGTVLSSFADAADVAIAVAVFSSVLYVFSFVLFIMTGVAALR